MIVTTTETVPGRETTEVLGVARGNTVRAKSAGRDFTQSIRNFFGGELKAYSDLMTRAREEAVERLEADAEAMGADAVVNVRFTTAGVAGNSAEILVYGTAVRLE